MLSMKCLMSTYLFVSSIQFIVCNGNQEVNGEANGRTERKEINLLVQRDKPLEPSYLVLNEAENLKPDGTTKRRTYGRTKFDSSRANNYESVNGMNPNEESSGSRFFNKVIRPVCSLFSALKTFIRPTNW